ncbi:MAG: adenylate/guanylate cyclase domain-containing protein [Dehalococcoidia bacterium]|nr:adenylate/guanylate cyclase domain-containing protein [Dehalococcoidia bacterium]
MEPRIQYAQTEDGVSIAYWAMGEGPPLIVMPNIPLSHVELEVRIPEYRGWYESLIENGRLVRYDNRGSGLSDRDVSDFSLEAHIRDLSAVADQLGEEQFALLAPVRIGPVAITYAVRHPERVSHLVFWCSFARGTEYFQSPVHQTLKAMRDKDWEIYIRTLAAVALGWEAGEPVRRYAAYMRESVSQDVAISIFDANETFDASDLLPQIKAATLVLHRRQVAFPPIELSRGLAARIPGARFAVLEGNSLAPFLGDAEAVTRAIEEFVREGEKPAAAPGPAPVGGTHTILFTDIEGSTALTQRLGDARARELMREHERLTREALKAHGGAEVKTMGDGFMASFSSATRALECAIALQRSFAERNESAAEPLRVRVGLNAGEPIEEEQDLFGTAVILAARIAAQAQGGEILVSEGVRQIVAGKKFLLADRGEVTLRGFEDPVHVYELSWRQS